MRPLLYTLFALCALLPPSTLSAQAPAYSRVRIDLSGPADLQRLLQLGLAVDHGEVRDGASITTDLSRREIGVLREQGVPHTVLIDDVQAYYVARNQAGAPKDRDAFGSCEPPPTFAVPQHFTTGTMGGYYTWEEMVAILDEMVAAYPELITAKQSIGESWEERPLYMVRMSNAPNVDQDKPEVLYDALHHAREPAGLTQLIFYMWYLLENYGTDAEATYLLDNMELYFVPCVNPDGYVFNVTNAPAGGGMWRKNRRDNGDGTFGVDLNRNYGQAWGHDDNGSSPDSGSDVYRGPAAFSEPETQALRDLCNAHTFRLALNYHTFGDLLIYPWGYEPSFYTPDSAIYANFGDHLTRDNRYLHGTSDQTVQYTVNGGSDDWMYGEQTSKPKIFSMTPEAGKPSDGFWPAEWRIPDICQVNMGQNLRMAHMAGTYGVITDRTGPVLQGLQPHVRFDLERLGLEPGTFTVSVTAVQNAIGAGAPKTFAGMALPEVRLDSITLNVAPGLLSGDTIRYVITVDNGIHQHHDTLTKLFGAPAIAFIDLLTNEDHWQGPSAWGVTTDTWYSPPSSMADSPDGNYSDNVSNDVTLEDSIDLADATFATLTFMAKWDIEQLLDYVQVLASSNGSTWIALCGRWTRPGSEWQDQDQPVYDGRQSDWVEERMDLGDFIGGPLHLRFQLVSDDWENWDGFYFDDLRVTTLEEDVTAVADMAAPSFGLACTPNPATDRVRATFTGLPRSTRNRLVLYDALGDVVHEENLAGERGSVDLSVADHASGVYLCAVLSDGAQMAVQRLVVARP